MSIDEQAESFARARRHAVGFRAYPGALPSDLRAAYAVQLAAIGLWPNRIAAWKVGRIAPAVADSLGERIFVDPIFAKQIRASQACNPFPAFAGGFAAFEAELIIAVTTDCPPAQYHWTTDEALAVAGSMFIGVEIAGSPLGSIHDLDTLATIAGYGNNNGLIVGAEISQWRDAPASTVRCITSISGDVVGQMSVSTMADGPLAALAFALGRAARLGLPIRKGTLISTGALTGVHPVAIGQQCQADFGRHGTVTCQVVEAAPNG